MLETSHIKKVGCPKVGTISEMYYICEHLEQYLWDIIWDQSHFVRRLRVVYCVLEPKAEF